MADTDSAPDLAEHDVSRDDHLLMAKAHHDAAQEHLEAAGDHLDALLGDGGPEETDGGGETARRRFASPAARGVDAVRSNPVTARTMAAMRGGR